MQVASTPTLGGGPHGGKWALSKKLASVNDRAEAHKPDSASKPSWMANKLKPTPVLATVAKTTGPSKARRQTVPAQMAKIQKKAEELVKDDPPFEDPEPVGTSRRASYAGISLKSTGNAAILKKGGDVVSLAAQSSGEAPGFWSTKLKKTPSAKEMVAAKEEPPKEVAKPVNEPPKVEKHIQTTTAKKSASVTPRRASYGGIALRPAPPSPTKNPAQQRRATYAEIELRQSAHSEQVKSGQDPIQKKVVSNFELPDEFNKVELKNAAATPVKPEVEVVQEAKPDYTSVQLKDASTPVQPEVEVLPEQTPEYTAVSLKQTEPVERPKLQARRASYSDVKLNKSSYGETIKSGGDVVKEGSDSGAEPSYSAVQLKKSGHGEAIKSGGDVAKKQTDKEDPSFAGVSLKTTEHGEAVKTGGDVVKEFMEDESRNSLPDEFATVQLKTADTPIKPEVEVMEEAKPDYAAVKLRAASTPVKPEVEILQEEKPDYSSVQLRAASAHVKPEVEVMPEQTPEYTAIALKQTGPVERPKVQARRASYADIKLNKSSQGEAIKSSGEVVKEEIDSTVEPSYSAVQLKKSGHGDAIKAGGDVRKNEASAKAPSFAGHALKNTEHGEAVKSGGDVVREAMEDASKNSLPDEFATVQLRTADTPIKAEVEAPKESKPDYSTVQLRAASTPIKPEVEVIEEQKPDYTAVQLKTASTQVRPEVGVMPEQAPEYTAVQLKFTEPITKPQVQARRASYSDIKLNKSSYGEAIKSGGDVIKEGSDFVAQPGYSEVQLKKSGHGDAIKGGGDVRKKEESAKAPSFAGLALRNTEHGEAVKTGGDVIKDLMEDASKNSLPEEFATVQLKTADAPIKPEVEVMEEAKPDYAAVQLRAASTPFRPEVEIVQPEKPDYSTVQLKDASTLVKPEVEVMPEQAPEHTVVSLKQMEPVERPKVQSRRASYSDIKLNKSSYGDAIKSGGDVVKEGSDSVAEPSYSAVQLKKSGHGHAVKSGGDVAKKQDNNNTKPSFAGVALKTTEHGDVVKSGGDVQKEVMEDESKHSLPDEFGEVQLQKFYYRTVQPEVDLPPEPVPEHTAVQLKTVEPTEKPVVVPRRASYADLQLKKSGHGDAIKSGKDVVKEVSSQEESVAPAFSSNQLKSTGQADILKSGGDVVKEDQDDNSQEAKPAFSGIQLKAAPTMERPEPRARRATYAGFQLKTATANESAKVEAAPPSFSGVKLKPARSGDDNNKQEPKASQESDDAAAARRSSYAKMIQRNRAMAEGNVKQRRATYAGVQLAATGRLAN